MVKNALNLAGAAIESKVVPRNSKAVHCGTGKFKGRQLEVQLWKVFKLVKHARMLKVIGLVIDFKRKPCDD